MIKLKATVLQFDAKTTNPLTYVRENYGLDNHYWLEEDFNHKTYHWVKPGNTWERGYKRFVECILHAKDARLFIDSRGYIFVAYNK